MNNSDIRIVFYGQDQNRRRCADSVTTFTIKSELVPTESSNQNVLIGSETFIIAATLEETINARSYARDLIALKLLFVSVGQGC